MNMQLHQPRLLQPCWTLFQFGFILLKHPQNIEARSCCPQTFLSLDFQCRDDVSELKQTLWH